MVRGTHTPRADLLPSGRNTNDDTLAPPLVTRLERGPHDVHIPRAVESVIAPTIRHLHQTLRDILPLLQVLSRVHKIRRPELLRPALLRLVDIHDDNLARAILDCALDNRQTHAPGAENRNITPLLQPPMPSRDDRRAITRRDPAPEQARPVHRRFVRDGHDGDVGHDGELREGRGAHEVQEVLALALEARGAVGHDAFALRGADFAAEVRLAGFAEFAFFAFGGAV